MLPLPFSTVVNTFLTLNNNQSIDRSSFEQIKPSEQSFENEKYFMYMSWNVARFSVWTELDWWRKKYSKNATLLLGWCHRYKKSTVVITTWLIVTKYPFLRWQLVFCFSCNFFSFHHQQDFYQTWLFELHGRTRNFASACIHSGFAFVGSVLFICLSLYVVFSILFVFIMFLVPNIVCVPGLPLRFSLKFTSQKIVVLLNSGLNFT